MTDTAYTNWDDTTMGQSRTQEAFDEVVIDNVSYPVTGINFTGLGRFDPKVTIGDYSKESDQLLSSWIQSSWSGGAMVDDHIEGATDSRFRFSTLWTRSPGQLTLPPEFHRVAEAGSVLEAATDVRVIGDFLGDFFVSGDGNLIRVEMDPALCPNFPLRPTTPIVALGGQPVARGVAYKDTLYIPLGLNGLATYTATGGIVTDGTKEAVSLVVWDNKLAMLTVDGELVLFNGTTWDAVTDGRTLPRDRRPRHLVWL